MRYRCATSAWGAGEIIANTTRKGKTGVFRKGCVVFKTCTTDARRPQGDGGYAGQIEAFGVFCPELKTGYLVPIDDLASPFLGYLRVDPPLNGQTTRVRWAHKYEIGTCDVKVVDLRPPVS